MSLKSELEKLQKDSDKLKKYDRFFDALLRDEFGLTKKEIHKRLNGGQIPLKELTIAEYFGLKNDDDWHEFLDIICSEKILDFYHKMMASRG